MIVKCEQCQTRFKIPDDKVTDKGVKVRCTKCGNTFRVGKDGAALPGGSSPSSVSAPPAAVAPSIAPVSTARTTLPPKSIQLGGDDPFEPFGAPPKIPDDEATRPGVFVLGLEASRVPEMGAPPIPPQAPSKPPAKGASFDFGSLAPPPPAAVAPPPVPAASTAQAARPAPRAPAPTASVPAAPPPGPATTSPFDFSALMAAPAAPADQPAPFDFSALGAPPPPPAAPQAPASRPVGAPPPVSSTPAFDFSALGPLPELPGAGRAAPAAPAAPPPAAASTPAFDFSGFGPPPPGPSASADAVTAQAPALVPGQTARIPMGSQPGVPGPTARIPMGSQPGVPGPSAQTQPGVSAPIPTGTQPGLGARFPTATQPAIAAPPPSAPPAPKAPARPQSSAPLSMEGDDLGPTGSEARTEQMPGLFDAPSTGADDFFGGSMTEPQGRPALAPDVTGEAAKQALFDMAAALPAAPPDEPTAAPEPAAPAPPTAPQPATRSPAALDSAPRRRRTALGIVVNVVIAAVLVVALVVVGSAYLNEGKVSAETLTWDHLKATFAPSSDYVAGDISNGLYDTKAGRPVFFVRGEVVNRGASATRLVVRAELLEGATLVRSAESTAGAPPSPEELFGLVTAEDVDALNAKVAQRAPVVAPGEAAAFTVTFFEYPPDLKGFRVRVSARPASEPTARAP